MSIEHGLEVQKTGFEDFGQIRIRFGFTMFMRSFNKISVITGHELAFWHDTKSSQDLVAKY